MPPFKPPGPDAALHSTSPAAASTVQYSPLFWPAPTTCRVRPPAWMVNRCGPSPKSKSGPGLLGQLSGGRPGMQPPFQSSKRRGPAAHLIAPVVRSSARIELMWSSGDRHSAAVPPASWQSFADCGTS
jgi:hypothetical protein